MLGAAGGAALVAGGASAPLAPDDVRIRVLRSFIWAREPVPVGHEMPLSRRVARELALAGKAEILPDAPPAEPAPDAEAAKAAAEAEAAKAAAEAEAAKAAAEAEAAATRRQKKEQLV